MSAARCTVFAVVTVVFTASLTAFAQAPADAPQPDLAERVKILNSLQKKPDSATASTPTTSAASAPAPTDTKPPSPPDLSPAATLTVPAGRPRLDLPDPGTPHAAPSDSQKTAPTGFPRTWMDTSATNKTGKNDKSRSADAGSYTIGSGDTFSSIAKAKLGDVGKWTLIAKANPKIDPMRLKVGQVIKLPSATDIASATKPDATAPATLGGNHVATHPLVPSDRGGAAPSTVTVSSGDNLHTIARRVYGKPGEWHAIFEANRDKLQDPDDLQAGMVLKIPAAKATKSN